MERSLFIKKPSPVWRFVIYFLILAIAFVLFRFVYKSESVKKIIRLSPVVVKPAGEVAFVDESGKPKDRLIILVLGLDENRDQRGIVHHKGSRTDTIFLLSLDRNGKRLGILSIPRDTWVYVSDKYGENRINTAYVDAFWDEYDRSHHDYELAKAAGIAQAKETIENFLGIHIDHYILLKIDGAKELVDALGGLTIDVEKDMNYDDNWGHLHIHLKKGRQRLNGADVIGYARFRHDLEGDWGRIRRQQQVIKAFINELKKPTHIMDINKIAKVVKNNIDTDMSVKEMVDIARVYKDFNKDNLVRGVITGDDDIINGNMVIIPNKTLKVRLVNRILKDPSKIPPGDIWVKVLNGCGVSGLGAKNGDKLKAEGYNVVEIGNALKEDYKVTQIQDHFLNEKTAKKIAKILGVSSKNIVHRPESNGLTVDFTIILGKDVVETPPSPTPSPKG